jgi:hypothetical protein
VQIVPVLKENQSLVVSGVSLWWDRVGMLKLLLAIIPLLKPDERDGDEDHRNGDSVNRPGRKLSAK